VSFNVLAQEQPPGLHAIRGSRQREATAVVDLFAPRAAEFFAGIGLVRQALAQAGIRVVFANDIDAVKAAVYRDNHGGHDLLVDDVANVHGDHIPDIDVATASFPCTDLSLAGNRAGLNGKESGTFWHFARVIEEMGDRKPMAILLENVAGLGSSRGGDDLRAAIARLNGIGYWCDILTLDAKVWVPQSRNRVFVVGSLSPLHKRGVAGAIPRPAWIGKVVERYPNLRIQSLPLQPPRATTGTLASVVERLEPDDPRWWDAGRLAMFLESLSTMQALRLSRLKAAGRKTWRTAYRRTRQGRPVWEIRPDGISGCLRTARGGSSRQALVQAGNDKVSARWMTSREYARLMGAADLKLGAVTENQALSCLGDAVCVPAVAWLAREYLVPLIKRDLTEAAE
jgi:DNA (cytosine-5)-methyltransferase 1